MTKNQKIKQALEIILKVNAGANPELNTAAHYLQDALPQQQLMLDDARRNRFISLLRMGMPVKKACREVRVCYGSVRHILREIGWDASWHWRDMTRKIGRLTLGEIRAAYGTGDERGVMNEIAHEAGVSRQRIHQVLEGMGVARPYSMVDEYQDVIRLLDEGGSISDVMKLRRCSRTTATGMVARLRRAHVARAHLPKAARQPAVAVAPQLAAA